MQRSQMLESMGEFGIWREENSAMENEEGGRIERERDTAARVYRKECGEAGNVFSFLDCRCKKGTVTRGVVSKSITSGKSLDSNPMYINVYPSDVWACSS